MSDFKGYTFSVPSLPVELYRRLRDHCKAVNVTQRHVVITALERYLDTVANGPTGQDAATNMDKVYHIKPKIECTCGEAFLTRSVGAHKSACPIVSTYATR
jgi:hypothetical protein